MELTGSHAAADKQFKELENRWPEWYNGWLGNALVLEARHQPQEAEAMRQAAAALGAPSDIGKVGAHGTFGAAEILGILPVLFPQEVLGSSNR